MANFSAPVLISAVSTAFKTGGFLYVGGVKTPASRAQVYEIEMGHTAAYASTDAPVQWDLSRAATPGLTGANVAANLLDLGDYVAGTLFTPAATAEPTYTTAGLGLSIKQFGLNQRGFNRWRALDDGDNIILPATAGVGIGLRAVSIASGFTGSAIGAIAFQER